MLPIKNLRFMQKYANALRERSVKREGGIFILCFPPPSAPHPGVATGFAGRGARFPEGGLYNRIESIFLSMRKQFSFRSSPTGIKIFPDGEGV